VVASAEAGVNAAYYTLQTTPTASLPCSVTGTMATSPNQQYSAAITYYDAAGNTLTCQNPGLLVMPAKAQVTSTGSPSPGGANPNAKRTMQSLINLTPVYGGFDSAIFSDSSPTTANNVTVHGDVGDDADVYTNGSWSCGNSMTIHGQMIAQGSISMSNSCQVTKDVWANGSVSMSNSSLAGHNVTSSTSSISLSNSAHILNNATAGTTISNGTIDGTKTPNAPQAAPPAKSLPTITFDSTSWQAAGYTVQNKTCSQVGAVSSVSTSTVYRISPACSLQYANNTTISLSADMAIVTDGSISMANKTTFQSGDGAQHSLYFIMPTGTACPGGNFSTSNNTSFSGLKVFVFTPCNASFSNSNTGVGGQIYAGNVSITNLFSMNFLPAVVPSASSVTGYKVDITYVREINNP
ncbi:MAG TPA: hypothetical protein VG076_13940, partial [Acidimicrobiales bacterium]|nr:hypothetical protein [Acidimicrobiales bacterium]